MWKIETISSYQADQIYLSCDSKGKYSQPGLYIVETMDGYTAIDNSTNDAWTEEFDTREAAEKWLTNPSFTRDDIVRDDDYAEA